MFLARRLTYRIADLPRKFEVGKGTLFVRDLFNSTIIDEALVTLEIEKNKFLTAVDGVSCDVYKSIEGGEKRYH